VRDPPHALALSSSLVALSRTHSPALTPAQEDYAGDYLRINDVARCSLIAPSLVALEAALTWLMNEAGKERGLGGASHSLGGALALSPGGGGGLEFPSAAASSHASSPYLESWDEVEAEAPPFTPLLVKDRMAPTFDAEDSQSYRYILLVGRLSLDGGADLNGEFRARAAVAQHAAASRRTPVTLSSPLSLSSHSLFSFSLFSLSLLFLSLLSDVWRLLSLASPSLASPLPRVCLAVASPSLVPHVPQSRCSCT
jgi:hypothetical protein